MTDARGAWPGARVGPLGRPQEACRGVWISCIANFKGSQAEVKTFFVIYDQSIMQQNSKMGEFAVSNQVLCRVSRS